MSVNALLGCQLAATAAGTTAPTALAVQPGAGFVQVSTCALTSLPNGTGAYALPGVSLPVSAACGQSITVRNDGLGICAVWPTATTSSGKINGMAAGNCWLVAPNGGICTFVSSDSLNWVVSYESGVKQCPILLTASAITLTAAWNNCLIDIPAMSNIATITLPAPTSNQLFRFHATGTVGNAVTIASSGINVAGQVLSCVTAAGAANSIGVAAGGVTNLLFSATAIVGDYAEFKSGTSLYTIQATTRAAAGMSTS